VALVFDVQAIVERAAQFLRLDGAELTRKLAQVVIIWLLAWVATRLVRLAARRIERMVDDGDPTVTTLREKRGLTVAQLLRTVGGTTVLLAAFLLTLNLFVEIGPLLAGAGIIGLAISFGAQSLVKDFISGFFILLEDQFVVGDVIEAAGKSGVVERMSLRVVVLRDLEGVMHVIPNGEIKVVSNKTRDWSRAVIDVGVGHEADVDHALDVLRDEGARFSADPGWRARLDGPVEVPGVESLSENAVVIRVLTRTQPGSQWDVARELRRRIKKRLDAEGLETPVPQRRVHVKVEGSAGSAATVATAAAAGGA
jgi:moderate conductance mechanosensitive channel